MSKFSRLPSSQNSGLSKVGEIKAVSTPSLPNGYLACDGSDVSRTTYADLFNTIGTTYGVGDGSTTFTLPDLRGRHPVGDGQGPSLSNRTVGESGGEEEHTLSTSELPSHNHDPYYDYFINRDNQSGNAHEYKADWDLRSATETNYTGGSTGHNNLPPYTVVKWAIKY